MIQTERTHLRPIASEDNEALFAYRSDAETNQYQGWVPKTLEEVNQFIQKNPIEFNQPDSWFQLVIIEKATDQLIGDIGVHFIDEHQVELGCTLSKSMHGKGFAVESMSGVITYLFNDLKKHRITTSIDPLNISSIKLVERLNFRKEAHFKESLLINGEWLDDIIYATLASEWKN